MKTPHKPSLGRYNKRPSKPQSERIEPATNSRKSAAFRSQQRSARRDKKATDPSKHSKNPINISYDIIERAREVDNEEAQKDEDVWDSGKKN